jgi:hypothetical protein
MTSLSGVREETPSEAASTSPLVVISPADRMLANMLGDKVAAGTASEEEKAVLASTIAKMEAAVTPLPSRKELLTTANELGSKLKSGTGTLHERQELEKVLAELAEANAMESKLRSKTKEKETLRAKTEAAKAELAKSKQRLAPKVRESKIKEMMDALAQLEKVDLCFLLDSTMSMGPYIAEAKNKIQLIVKELRAANPMLSLRVAFVGYRDPLEGSVNVAFDFQDLMTDGKAVVAGTGAFEAFVAGVTEQSGGDFCEDVASGFKEVLALSWDKATPTKVLFHIGDAPCHGREFHGPQIGDNHLHNDGGILDLLRKLKELGVDYYFGKLTDYTDMMIDKFNRAVSGSEQGADFVQVAPLDAPSAFVGTVTKKVRSSIEVSKKTETAKIHSRLGPLRKAGEGIDFSEIKAAIAASSATK